VWSDEVLRDMTIACLSLASYFLLREAAQLRAMYKLSLAKNWFKDAWNYVDVLASAGSISLGVYFFRFGPGEDYDHYASIVSLFMWMKVLGFAKAFSQQIATFVLMLSTIFKDLRSFLAVLFVIIIMFGHAFYLLLAVPEEDYVEDEEAPPVLVFQRVQSTFFSLYLMLLGKLDEPESFKGPWPTGLFMGYSFIVFVVMLNVLIAIVSDSYDAVLVTSTELFWRSRLELIAEITTVFDWLLCGAEIKQYKIKKHSESFWSFWGVVIGFEEDHAWSNGNSKVALGFRVVFIPVLLPLTIVGFIYTMILAITAGFFLQLLKEGKLIQELGELSWYIFSRLHLFAILPMVDEMNDRTLETLTAPRAICTLFALPFTVALALLLLIFTALVFLTYLTISFLDLVNRTFFKSEASDGLDLKLDSASTDWSGRVLDIVRRINSRTAAEVAKSRIEHR